MSKNIVYDHDARRALEAGMNILARVVSITLGPKGKNVILESGSGTPQIVNDGITIAKAIELTDVVSNMGVMLMRQAALKTNDVVGDGTTTSTVLAHAIIREGIKAILAGGNPILIKKGIDKAVNFVVSKIVEYAQPVMSIEDIIDIASISSGNNIAVGNTIAKALKQVGREGIISLEDGQSTITSIQLKDGMSFDQGYLSSYFLSSSSQTEIHQDNPLILLTDKKITLVQQELIPLLEQIAAVGRPLLIIAEDIEKEALSTLILNKLKGVINVVAVRTPGFGDTKAAFLEDIAILTQATIISDKFGLSLDHISLDYLGSASRITIRKKSTTIIAKMNTEALSLHCHNIKKQMELTNNNHEKELLQYRLAKLSGGVAIIQVGAATEAEMIDNKLRFEDALNATRAALEEGILPGGGSTLVHLSHDLCQWSNNHLLFDELLGAQIVVKALLVPLYTIIQNAGNNGAIIIDTLQSKSFSMGYDAENCCLINMYSAGIIDPAKVTRLALQNASSIASMVLTTECVISKYQLQSNV